MINASVSVTKTHKTLSFWPVFVIGIMTILGGFYVFNTIQHDDATIPMATDHNPIDQLYKRANSHYYQYSKAENESALQLYEKIIASDPNHALSQSGMANALVQQLIRWPTNSAEQHVNLLHSIAQGHLSTPKAVQQLDRAQGLAIRATELAPDNAIAHRSLGLVYAAQQQFDLAQKHYLKAIELDPNEWGAMINLADIYNHQNNPTAALETLKTAHAAMDRVYDEQEVIVRPWFNKLAIVIAEKNTLLNQHSEAEIWYRQVLNTEPTNQQAVMGLAQLLRHYGDTQGAEQLCQQWSKTMQQSIDC